MAVAVSFPALALGERIDVLRVDCPALMRVSRLPVSRLDLPLSELGGGGLACAARRQQDGRGSGPSHDTEAMMEWPEMGGTPSAGGTRVRQAVLLV
ncbi:hypothetical protein BV392_00375 [Rhodovulum sulfidophilum]|nr:hypothetical protein BV392_00375 [Rhodovulum sulfidophilum]